ncbi:MAG TPA: peptidyl-prolyl cis-trans isomerase [Pyrinomonadaceae bacterium]|nr:peptidyl-prolyl cis-trans isomerase [Pyrinomonadaceae bacterium]
MLKFFSRLERTRNFVLLIFAIMMAASLVLFYAPTRNGVQTNLSSSSETAAKVGSEVITVGEIATQKENLSRMYGGRSIPAKLLIDGMVRERIVRAEVNRLGLTATDAEVAANILASNKPQDGKPFDQKVYEQNVTEQFGSVKAYEQAVRDQIGAQKLEAYITSGVSVSEAEVVDDYKRRNTKFDLSFVTVSTAELAKTLKPSDEELKAYFEANKKNYYIGVPQKKIRYIFINTSKIGEKLNIPDEDLKAEYDKLDAARKQAGVNGQQIVFKVPKPDEDGQVLAKATEIADKAKKDGGKISEEAFAELAKGYSQDTASALNGGKLKGLVRSNPNNPTDPYQRLLTMEEGQVTEPVKYGTAYYILRRGASVPKTFEDAKKELEVSLRNRRSYTAAAELAQKVSDKLKEVKDVQKVAEEFAAQANSNAKDMVRETGFVKPGDDVENIGISPQFEDGIAPLEEIGAVGEKTPVKDGFAIPMLAEKREPRDATFEEVKSRVEEVVKADQAKAKVEQIAKDIASGAANTAGLGAAATGKGLKAEESKNFVLGSPLGQGENASTSKDLEDAINTLKAGEVSKTPIKVGDSWYIVGVTNRTEADMTGFAKERDQILQGMLAQKRSQVFSDYIADARQRMETAGQIKVYKEVVERIDAADKTADTPEGQQ